MTITYRVGNGLYVNVTNRCTNSCDFCVRSVADGTYGELWLEKEPSKEEILDAVLQALSGNSYDEVVFCGYGEPTVRLDDVIFVAKGIKKDFPSQKIRINTNGQANLIHGKDVTSLLAGVIDCVSVSLNAPDPVEYQNICHSEFGEAAFWGLLDFASDAKKYVPSVILSVVRETIPDSDIEKCRSLADKYGVKLKVRDFIK